AGAEEFWVVINASNTAKDLEWVRSHAGSVWIEDQTDVSAMIAVQGPQAPGLVASVAEIDVAAMDRFAFALGRVGGVHAVICRTGYTGEDGFELIVRAADASDLWRKLRQGGGVPCGLGAR